VTRTVRQLRATGHWARYGWVLVYGTRYKARSMGVYNARHADDLVSALVGGRPVSVFEDWLAEAQLFFEELMR
jgi:hypothetical protein